jgi:uncharacterized RDD family membrane protein YckC
VPASEKLIIDTPEQVPLEFALASVGSRFLALAADTLLQLSALFALAVVAAIVRWSTGVAWPTIGPWTIAVLLAAAFAVNAAYFALFESLWRGQTPGKRKAGLRVIDLTGRPVGVYAALIRNLVRLVDQVPGIYAIGILSVLVSPRQQRLGDIAAGTVVVHERSETLAPLPPPSSTSFPSRAGAHRLTPEEVLVVESFLQRRASLDSEVRLHAARRIAQRMAARLSLDPPADDEMLLEQLAAEYRSPDHGR